MKKLIAVLMLCGASCAHTAPIVWCEHPIPKDRLACVVDAESGCWMVICEHDGLCDVAPAPPGTCELE